MGWTYIAHAQTLTNPDDHHRSPSHYQRRGDGKRLERKPRRDLLTLSFSFYLSCVEVVLRIQGESMGVFFV
jgi:hypothetical protein